MFWWLSFLRPPPVVAPTSGKIEFIVQITNDLRTELYPDPIDLYFTWASSPGFRQFTDPIKLTTWRQEIAHKVLSVPGPFRNKSTTTHAAITWSLGLFASSPGSIIPSASATFINLTDSTCSSLANILPVFSAPISFSAPGSSPSPSPSSRAQSRSAANSINSRITSNSTKKQDEIQRVYLLPRNHSALDNKLQGHYSISPEWRSVIITEKTSPDLDKKVWDSGLSCSSWLARHATTYILPHQLQNVSDTSSKVDHRELVVTTLETLFTPGCTVLELGTGSGIVSVILASLLDEIHSVPSGQVNEDSDSGIDETNSATTQAIPLTRIYTTDLSTAIPLINRNISANRDPYRQPLTATPTTTTPPTTPQQQPTSEKSHGCPLVITADVLNWDDDDLPEEVRIRPCDIILMSDVTYNTASFPALLKTLQALLALSPHAHVILAYKERHGSERQVWDLFEKDAGLAFVKVEELDAAGPPPTEIWLGKKRVYEQPV